MNENDKKDFNKLEQECLEFIKINGEPLMKGKDNNCHCCYELNIFKALAKRLNRTCPYSGLLTSESDVGVFYTYKCNYKKSGGETK